MEAPSILNDVLGPVMRGPSSSHTAGSYHIGKTLFGLLGERPSRAEITFDPAGSYARTYRQQGVDLALATGLMGRDITDRRFKRALEDARRAGLAIKFRVAPIRGADHPNTAEIRLVGRAGQLLAARAKSTGGGSFMVSEIDGWPVGINGKAHEVQVLARRASRTAVAAALPRNLALIGNPGWKVRGTGALFTLRLAEAPGRDLLERLRAVPGVVLVRTAMPVYFVQTGLAIFDSAAAMLRLARRRRFSLGQAGMAYEASLLGRPESAIATELLRRADIMARSVSSGFGGRGLRMQLLRPSAAHVLEAVGSGRVAAGGLHARAASRALAAMHVSNSMGVVVAAPTGGSAGVIPGALVSMIEEWGLSREKVALSLAAAGSIGLIVAARATFAAEVAGCQVEIGAAGAMAAAAVVEAAGGTARQAADAAAISFQNTMGSVCDLVQGMCEIPCHTRNAVAASGAFTCADLVLGGYVNPVPLDETVDAVFDCGKMLPAELRCTARGGLALAPSARKLPNLRARRRR